MIMSSISTGLVSTNVSVYNELYQFNVFGSCPFIWARTGHGTKTRKTMKYIGSKNKFAKELIPIICHNLKRDQWYVEPFCGGCNLIDKVIHPFKIANDRNKYLIALLQHVQAGNELPRFIPKEEFVRINRNKDNYPDWLVGHINLNCTFSNLWEKGYYHNHIIGIDDNAPYNPHQIRCVQILKQQVLKNIQFKCCDYQQLELPPNSIIYCDPPYARANMNKSLYLGDFDSESFWIWAKQKVEEGHDVFVSEFDAPDNWTEVWSKEVGSLKSGQKNTEKLFTYKK